MIWVLTLASTLLALLFFLRRKELAELESMIAGGTVLPGCIIVQALFFLLLAAVALVAWSFGIGR